MSQFAIEVRLKDAAVQSRPVQFGAFCLYEVNKKGLQKAYTAYLLFPAGRYRIDKDPHVCIASWSGMTNRLVVAELAPNGINAKCRACVCVSCASISELWLKLLWRQKTLEAPAASHCHRKKRASFQAAQNTALLLKGLADLKMTLTRVTLSVLELVWHNV